MPRAKLHEEIQVFRGNRDLTARRSNTSTARTSSKPPGRNRCCSSSGSNTARPSSTWPWHSSQPAAASMALRRTSPPLKQILRRWRGNPRQLLRIERKQIGAISREMEALAAPNAPARWTRKPPPRATRVAEGVRNACRPRPRNPRRNSPSRSLLGITADGREMTVPSGAAVRGFAVQPRRIFGDAPAKWATASGTSSPRIRARRTPRAGSFPRSSAPWS
jgi:hypothetical protein